MNLTNTIYIIGLIVVSIYLFFGIDDLIWDIVTAFNRLSKGKRNHLPIAVLDKKPPRLLGIVIAAWHEDAVLEPVIDNIIASVQYPKSMYHIFLGVYPNDSATIAVAERLAGKYANVHVIINANPGPTCKADNINNMLKQIRVFEDKHGWEFASITVHDSEDVVHPYEFKVTNYLIDEHDALQFPVFPLQEKPTVKNFFQNMTSGTYADEFAENHFRTMVLRDESSAIVPSAGTGFVLTRRVLDAFGGEDVFPRDSLTEDYRLSLTMAEMGFDLHYVLERVPRVLDNGEVKWDYISTRSMFPSSFGAAVRQKTRWIYGITMQSVRLRDLFSPKKIGFGARYSLYKDLKAKFANLAVVPGYALLMYFVASFFLPLPVVYPMYTLSWWMCMALTALMVYRQILRAIAVKNIYGWRSVVVACLAPPIMPLRLVWGNIINMTATLRAWKQYFVGTRKKNAGKKQKWSKTDHEFLAEHILKRYHRTLGDVLIEKGYANGPAVFAALQKARSEGKVLGTVLIEDGIISESELLSALANVHQTIFLPDLSQFVSEHALSGFGEQTLLQLGILPLLRKGKEIIIAMSDSSDNKAIALLTEKGYQVQRVYARSEDIQYTIGMYFAKWIDDGWQNSPIYALYAAGKLSGMQMLLTRLYQQELNASQAQALAYMGFGHALSGLDLQQDTKQGTMKRVS
ncbi:phage adsorption protein NrfB [Eubacteriales bacterium OttesenSCG-928-N14]|nr:phage adsorption protein NrfB [Eubacteriales bacterium OttesenSCG-928-N14]